MLCDRCGRNEANMHINSIREGKKVTINLCSECAIKDDAAEIITSDLSEHLLGFLVNQLGVRDRGDQVAVCPACGWKISDLQRTRGMLGCPECYNAFAGMISLLKDNCTGSIHVGKRSAHAGVNTEAEAIKLAELKTALARCVREENYEKAAEYRDRIAELENKLKEDNGQ